MLTLVRKYFPQLTPEQLAQYDQLPELYAHWNSQINVISRKDIGELECHHILHSLGITQMLQFKDQSKILDFGTGGGFPGIPLAIMFPKCHFLLVDSIGKKVKVASEIAQALGLQNVETLHARGEQIKQKFDFIVSRAVTTLPDLVKWIKPLVSAKMQNGLPNGLICLKGGDVQAEVRAYKKTIVVEDLYPRFEEEFFKTKKVIYLPL